MLLVATPCIDVLTVEQVPFCDFLCKTALANRNFGPFLDPDLLDTPNFWL